MKLTIWRTHWNFKSHWKCLQLEAAKTDETDFRVEIWAIVLLQNCVIKRCIRCRGKKKKKPLSIKQLMDKACSEPSADGPPRPSSRGLTQTLLAPSCGAALFIPVSHLWASPARALQSNLPPHLPPRRAPQETHTSCPWPHLAPQQGDGGGECSAAQCSVTGSRPARRSRMCARAHERSRCYL